MQFTDRECRAAFVAEMNRKAAAIGMMNTTYTDPTGRGNPSNAYDICRSLVYASGYERLNEVWNASGRDVHFLEKDGSVRIVNIINKVTGQKDSSRLTGHYNVVGGKGGTLYRTTTIFDGSKVMQDIYNMAAICQSAVNPQNFYAITVMNDTGEDTKYDAVKATMDILDKGGYTGLDGGNEIIDPPARCICAFKLPNYSARAMGSIHMTPIYAKNAFAAAYPASMSKMMTSMIILDYIPDLHEKVTLLQEDIDALPTTSAWYVKDILLGETLTIEDLLYMIMLSSSNIATEIASRVVGERILCSRQPFAECWHRRKY